MRAVSLAAWPQPMAQPSSANLRRGERLQTVPVCTKRVASLLPCSLQRLAHAVILMVLVGAAGTICCGADALRSPHVLVKNAQTGSKEVSHHLPQNISLAKSLSSLLSASCAFLPGSLASLRRAPGQMHGSTAQAPAELTRAAQCTKTTTSVTGTTASLRCGGRWWVSCLLMC